uniref:FBD domain-containing protein n=1 Tax=Setaria viridis TaxID=4556 RepID=A0A4U6UXM2_SETVI|nr:hypothetical protein SEVIR_4G062900v2 [Setaria viridis]
MVVLDELHSPVKLETMRLALGGKSLRLPNTMKLASLTDLSLEGIKIVKGGVHLLGRLVSSVSCPHLEKLRMSKLWLDFNEEIRLEADVLSELWVEHVNVMSLQLRTPHLKVLHIDSCHHKVLRVSALRLEELALFIPLGCTLRSLEVDGDLPCVRNLKLCLWSHLPPDPPDGEAENDAGMLLLKHCSSVTCLHITLDGRKSTYVDLIKSRVPHLPHITSLIVNVSFMLERHDFGVGVASLLTRFNNLRRLSMHLPSFLSLTIGHPMHEISMAHVQEVELTGLTGTDCELWFMKAMLASAAGLCKVAISFNPQCGQHLGKMDAFERMLLDEGMLTSHREALMLTCHSWASRNFWRLYALMS